MIGRREEDAQLFQRLRTVLSLFQIQNFDQLDKIFRGIGRGRRSVSLQIDKSRSKIRHLQKCQNFYNGSVDLVLGVGL
jgi:hypothetical protein